MAFDLLTNGGHVEGVRAREHGALATHRMVERQLLRDGTALRVTEHRGRVDGQMVEQTCEVGCEMLRRIRRRELAAPPVTAQVGNDHAMSGRELVDHRGEHFAGDHEPVYEQQRRAGSSLGEGEQARGSHRITYVRHYPARSLQSARPTKKHNAPVGSRGR